MQDHNHSPVLCIGAAHWDVRSQCSTPVRRGTSNPVSVSRFPGGVAHNVAMNLCRLGGQVGLASRWGDDPAGDAIARHLAASGLSLLALPRSKNAPTATYTAVLEPDGELAVGLADMAIYDELTPDLLEPLHRELSSFPIWFVDTNIPAKTLEALADWQQGHGLLTADAVSVAKSTRLLNLLDRLGLLFCNCDEAAELSGVSIGDVGDIHDAGVALIAKGVGAVMISAGKEGAFLFQKGIQEHFPARKVEVVDVTGAGDALIAGTLHGIARGFDFARAVQRGVAAAALTLEKHGATFEGLHEKDLDAFVAGLK
ncbi:carbohydrate kinase family protein [Kiloniella laminariae]|uniref:carbohydrate kinase family protein n=1 Tax=Kiloniella laminariae TaxID=454162 RepID=UPI0012F77F0A|nr:carbohydrate kinase family protein [Kiloniella laminariae]